MSIPSFSVDNNGAANLSIPILVPPARVAPKLSLAFSSQGQNGLLGMGMSLTGLSAIHRCPRTFAQDGAKGGINYDANDRFCIDGSRLIVINGLADGASGAEYRTEIDTFLRVGSQGVAGSGPAYWMVKNKNGETMEFGNTADSRIEAQGKTSVRVWALNKITDASGNYLTVTYTEDSANGDYRPLRIDYTGNSAQGLATQRKVEFSYETRTDQVPLYVGGSLVKTTQRLAKIQTYAPPPQGGAAVLVREYRLAYEYGAATKRSRLKTIAECDANNACLPVTAFTWQEGGDGKYTAHPISLPSGFADTKVWLGDFNSDGKTDFVSGSVNGKLTTFLSRFNLDGTYPGTSPYQSVQINTPSGFGDTKVWIGDFNSDGKTDFVSGSVNGKLTTFLSRFNLDGTYPGTSPYQSVQINTPSGFADGSVWIGDMDGDGRTDIVSSAGGNLTTFFSRFNQDGTYPGTSPYEAAQTPSPTGFSNLKAWVIDANGDGRSDFVSGSVNGKLTVFLSNGDGTYQSVENTTPADFSDTKVWIGDFNADGKGDLLTAKNGKLTTLLSKGDGTFDVRQITIPSGFTDTAVWIADTNGDGHADIISVAGGNLTTFYSNGDGTYWSVAMAQPSGWNNNHAWTGEFTGDGKLDGASTNNGNLTTFRSNGSFPDLLTSLTTNLGGKIDIAYKPLTDSSVYTKENDAVYPVIDVQSAMYVVDNYVAGTNDGTGTSYTFTYDYIGAKFHLLGRGWLGFHQTTGVDQSAGVKNVHIFRQVDPQTNLVDFPFVGMQDLAQTKDMQEKLFAQVKNFYTSFGTQAAQPKVVFPTVTRQVKDQCEGVTDPQGNPLCFTTAQTFEFDTDAPGGKTYGNPIHTFHEGDVSVTGDERHERSEWLVNAFGGNWLHRPKTNRLLDSSNAVIREKYLYYDDLPYGSLGSRGLVTKEESSLTGGPGDPGNPAIVHAYDAFGNRDSTTDPLGCMTKTVFDSLKTFPVSVTRCFADPNPNLVHVTTFDHDPRFGTRTRVTDANNNTTTYTFDAFGRLTKVVGPLDSDAFPSETRAYLNWGNAANQRIEVSKRKDHGGAAVISREDYFDGLGRFDFIRSIGPNDPATGQPRNIVEQSFYDSRGLILRKIPSHFEGLETPLPPWEYTYDVMGRQVRVDHPDFRYSDTIYEPGKVTLINERGKSKVKHLDGYGQVEQIDEINGSETYTTIYDYDAAGLLVHVKNHLDHHTRIQYDSLGRKIAMCDPNMGAGPNTTICDASTPGSWVYTYDNAGNLKTQADAKLKPLGQYLEFFYDSHGRMTRKNYPNGSFITFAYDLCANGVGRLCQVNDLNSMVTAFLYDPMGRVTQTQRVIDSTYTMSQTYNALSKVTTETFPDLEMVSYTYDEAGWLKSVGGFVNLIDYNARGQKKKIDYFNNVSTTFAYFDQDTGGQFINFALENRTTTGPGAPTGNLQNLTYDYDEVGNVEAIIDGLPSGTAGRTFGYDDLNRMTSASGMFGANQSQTSCTYTYNAIGNILNKCGVVYSYDDPMHPSFVTSRSDGKSYTADINGNTQTGDGRSFAWTADNRVESVTMGGTTTMDYDYTGQRVKKYGPLGPVLYPFAGYEIDPVGTKTKFFRAGTELLASKQTKTTGEERRYFYHNDHLGGVNVITDDDPAHNGARVQLNEYDPWGKVSRSEGNVDPEKRFTGQILDPESGLYYYGARYYDPELARFISPDPIVPSPGDPQSLNRYSYVLNNPVKYIDPTGHGFWSRIGNFFKNLFRNPLRLFTSLITGPAGVFSIFIQAIAAGIGGNGGLAFSLAAGGPLAALSSLPGVSGGIAILGGVITLASGNPAGLLMIAAGGLSFCKAKGCQIASPILAVAGMVASVAYASTAGQTGGKGPAGPAAVGEQLGSGAGRELNITEPWQIEEIQEMTATYAKGWANESVRGAQVVLREGTQASWVEGWENNGNGKITLRGDFFDLDPRDRWRVFGHELKHLADYRADPNFSAKYNAFGGWGTPEYYSNPYERIAEHRGVVFAIQRFGPNRGIVPNYQYTDVPAAR